MIMDARRRPLIHASLIARTCLLCAFILFQTAGCSWIDLVDRSTGGDYSEGNSSRPSLSHDGRYIAFHSTSDDLVANDTNSWSDIFVRDTLTQTTTRVSVDDSGGQSNQYSELSVISGNGRYVAFISGASNLVEGDTNEALDIFVHDTATGRTTRASVSSDGEEGDDDSTWPSISRDGRFVAFQSEATNLVEGDTNGDVDIFVRDLAKGTTVRASVSSDGVQGDGDSRRASLSADGSFVAFDSVARTLDPVNDLDPNFRQDVFVHSLSTGTTTMVSLNNAGLAGIRHSTDPVISGDGRFVAFQSSSLFADEPIFSPEQIYLRDTIARTTVRLSTGIDDAPGTAISVWPEISEDGRFICFQSAADNLVADDVNGATDIFVADAASGVVTLVSADALGNENRTFSSECSIAGNGRYVGFSSRSCSLVEGICNNSNNVFVRAFPQPVVHSVVPDKLPIGATTSVIIHGSYFMPGAWVATEPSPRALTNRDPLVSNVTIIDESTISMDITAPAGTAPGSRPVIVLNPGEGPGSRRKGASGYCPDCLTLF